MAHFHNAAVLPSLPITAGRRPARRTPSPRSCPSTAVRPSGVGAPTRQSGVGCSGVLVSAQRPLCLPLRCPHELHPSQQAWTTASAKSSRSSSASCHTGASCRPRSAAAVAHATQSFARCAFGAAASSKCCSLQVDNGGVQARNVQRDLAALYGEWAHRPGRCWCCRVISVSASVILLPYTSQKLRKPISCKVAPPAMCSRGTTPENRWQPCLTAPQTC